MPTAYLEYDGKPVPTNDLVWYSISPCGCTSGVQTLDAGEGGTLALTEDQAWAATMRPKPIQDRDRKAGERMELGLRADVVTRLSGKCPHIPMWGREKTPVPDGYHWGREHNGRRLHLVPGEPDDRNRIAAISWRNPEDKITALCGKAAYTWDTDDYLQYEYLECAKCAKTAAGQATPPLELT